MLNALPIDSSKRIQSSEQMMKWRRKVLFHSQNTRQYSRSINGACPRFRTALSALSGRADKV
jgi:hypothetical protein